MFHCSPNGAFDTVDIFDLSSAAWTSQGLMTLENGNFGSALNILFKYFTQLLFQVLGIVRLVVFGEMPT